MLSWACGPPPFWMLVDELRTIDEKKKAVTLTKQFIPCVAVWGYGFAADLKGSAVGH